MYSGVFCENIRKIPAKMYSWLTVGPFCILVFFHKSDRPFRQKMQIGPSSSPPCHRMFLLVSYYPYFLITSCIYAFENYVQSIVLYGLSMRNAGQYAYI